MVKQYFFKFSIANKKLAGIVFVVLWTFLLNVSNAKTPFDFPVRKIIVDGKPYRVLVADTEFRRQQGLSYVELSDLKKNKIDGMLFVFSDDKEKTFQAWYMKFDLILLGLKKIGDRNSYNIIDKNILKVGTIGKIRGKDVLEIINF